MAVALSNLSVTISAVDRLSKPLASAGGRIGAFGKKALNVGKNLTLGVTLPAAAAGAAIISTSLDFERSINRVSALLNTPRASIAALEEQALSLGRSTAFAATEVGQAQGFLAQAGKEQNEILAMTPQVLNLAAAAQTDLAETSDLLTDVMAGFGMEASESQRAVDVLAQTTISATTDLMQLGEAFKFAAPLAKGANVPLEETAAVLALLADLGFKGTLGGTAFKNTLAGLLDVSPKAAAELAKLSIEPSDFLAADGTLKSLTGTIELLGDRGATVGQILTIFGLRAGPGMQGLTSQGVDGLRSLNQELKDNTVTAARTAELQLQGTVGGVVRLQSAFEGLKITIGKSGLIEAFATVVEKLTIGVQVLNETNPRYLKWGVILVGVAAAIGPVLIGVGLLATSIGGLVSLAGAASGVFGFLTATALPALGTALAGVFAIILGNPIGLAITAVVALTAMVLEMTDSWSVLGDVWDGLKKTGSFVFDSLTTLVNGFVDAIPDWVVDLFRGSSGGNTAAAVAAAGTPVFSSGRIDAAAGFPDTVETRETRDSRVRVEFANAPPGTRVTADGDEIDLDPDGGTALDG